MSASALQAAADRWRWQLQLALRQLGPVGWLALALGAVAAMLWLGPLHASRREAEALRSDTAELARQQQASRGDAQPDERSPARQWARFEDRLAPETGTSAAVARVIAIARHHGVALNQAEFKLSTAGDEPMSRYTLVLPLQADYRSIRGFVREVLREVPGIALQEFSLRRSELKSPLLTARLQFVLFLARRSS